MVNNKVRRIFQYALCAAFTVCLTAPVNIKAEVPVHFEWQDNGDGTWT